MKDKPNIRFVGNSPVLTQKIGDYFKSFGLDMTHFNESPNAECDYLIVIDPTEQALKRMRMQELWKNELLEKHLNAKMLVIDWWTCHCNGFVSPMDIPSNLDNFLARAPSVKDVICFNGSTGELVLEAFDRFSSK